MMKKYRVKKDFPSRGTQIFHEGEFIELPKDGHPRTKVLLDNGYIEKLPNFCPKVVAVSKLAKVEIADHDYIEGNKKHFSFDEALEIEKKLKSTGWRLPTRSEWVLICEEFGRNLEIDELEGQWLQKNLGLALNGYINRYSSSPYGVGSYGFYWSRTAIDSNYAYLLGLSSSNANPASSNAKYLGFSVRCVKDLRK